MITHTTDGGAGDTVTVAGFTVKGSSKSCGIYVDHVSNFTIAGNIVSGAYGNIAGRAASGTLMGNQLSNGNTVGFITEGGTGQFPASVSLIANRVNNSSELGISGVDYPGDLPLNLGQSGLTALPFQFQGPNPDLPNGLTMTLIGNDISWNGGVGVRLFVTPIYADNQPILTAGLPTMSVNIAGNTIANNHQYGIAVDGGDASSLLPSFSGSVLVTIGGNSLTGNGYAPALFTFYNYFKTLGGGGPNGHLEQAVYSITDLDGELTGFDYFNPVFDPATGNPNNDTLIVNGSSNILGIKLTSKP
jgi:hypothetical protein